MPAVFRRFDPAGRPVTVRMGAPDAPPIQQFTYQDAGGPPPPDAGQRTAGGRLVRIDDEAGVTLFDYDIRGRPSHKRWRPIGGASAYDLDMEYRADGRLAALVYPDGGVGRRRVEHIYDPRGRLVGAPTVAPTIELDLEGRMTGLTAQNGAQLTIAYDQTTGRPLSRIQTGPDGWRRSTGYAWDKVGNLLSITSTDDALASRFVYDDLYRLTHADTPLGEAYAYRYADNGAITFKSDVGTYRYGENGAPATCATTAGSQSLTYNAAGDVASAPWGDQTFDSLGRLVRVSRDGVTAATYAYDWSGQRVVATMFDAQGAPTVRMTPDSHFALEAGGVSLNLFAGPLPVARQTIGGATVYLHMDHLGGLIAVTDETGRLSDSLRYDPFGRLLSRTGAAAAQPEGFGGGDFDAAFGVIYLQARYYHPGLGVFLSVDPIVQDAMSPIAWNAYAYCGNNPASRADPSGLSFNLGKFIVGLVAVAALVALAVVTAGLSSSGITVVAFGAVSGGLIGGITVAHEESLNGAKPDFWDEFWDVALGASIGAAVGGWASYATVYGPALYGNLTGQGIGQAVGGSDNVLSGLLNNAVTQTAAGFAHAVAKPIAGTGDFGLKFWGDVAQSAISGAVSGAAQGWLFGGFSTRDLTDETQDAVFEAQTKEPFTGKFSPTNMPFSARSASAIIVSAEQVATSQIEWNPNFLAGTAQNAGIGTAVDVGAGLFATSILVISF
jgi:RHS repeat-associated protein